MSQFKNFIEDIVKNNREPAWLKDLRLAALSRFEESPPPGRNEEEWRKVDLNKVFFSDLFIASDKAPDLPRQDSYYLGTLSRAALDIPEVVRPYLERSQNHNSRKYDALVNAFWNGGVFLHVPDGVHAAAPLYVRMKPMLESAPGTQRASYFPKRIIVMGKNSSFTLISNEETQDENWGGWLGSLTEIYLQEGAHLSFLRVQNAGRNSVTLSSLYGSIERDASLNFMVVGVGSSLNKSNWNADLVGEGASANLYGLVKGEGTQNFDQTVCVTHRVPRGRSNVLFKTAMKDKSRSLFTGLIHVQKRAQRTDAYQTNRNLILSKEARADTLPKLEIEADDVKCGHGAAVSSLDPDQVFYLMSRGLNRQEAESLIVTGFYEDVLSQWIDHSPFKSATEEKRAEFLNWVKAVLLKTPASSLAEAKA